MSRTFISRTIDGLRSPRRSFSCRAASLSALLLVALLSGCGESPPLETPVRFVDAAVSAGIGFRHYNGATGQYYYAETYGSGAGFLDYDNDGWLDAYLVNGAALSGPVPSPPPINHLYRNAGDGTFSDVTAASGAGDPGYGMGCSAADYDNDGDQDLYVANFGPNVLYRNEGNGTFSDVTVAAGVGDPRWASSCGFFDSDRDGDLDLFVTNYVDYTVATNVPCAEGPIRSYCDPDTYSPITDLLYRNEGNGTFADVTRQAGITGLGRGLGVAFLDYDDDGDTDVYVANDGTMNLLYRNEGASFTEVGLQAGVWYNANGRAQAGMGVDAGDVDGDGRLDLVVGNFAMETNTLFRNLGEGQFEDATERCGLGQPSYLPLTFGLKLLDYDNDGDLDQFSANGHVLDNIEQISPGQTYAQANMMMRNDGDGRLSDVSAELGPDFALANVGRAVAAGDYDNDGDVDLLVSTEAGPVRLLRNEGGNRNHWLILHLQGAVQRDALSARVTVMANGRRLVRERQSGASYQATHDPRLHFGLGDATSAEVEIRWPDGRVQRLGQVAVDQILRVVQAP